MKHKHLITLVVMLFSFTFLSKAQFDSVKYDKEAFLIGTLDDYMGYQRTFTAGSDSSNYQKVDIYNTKESIRLALFIDSLFSSEYPDIFLKLHQPSGTIKMYSSSLSEIIDKYYDYKPFTGMTTIQGDTFFYGLIKNNAFKTDKEKLSFLLGVYLRYERNGTISIANSESKAALCAKMLKEFNCKDIEYTIIKGIPGIDKILFKPSEIIQELIDEANKLNNYISNNNTDNIKFTTNGTKYILIEPDPIIIRSFSKIIPPTIIN